ncbi:hypothetical protein OF83DRAFT_621295 [Amylostereum chailletii]|nr:hypothetical protein OF83DRAFT_621295 [Amylostereum chailletii]
MQPFQMSGYGEPTPLIGFPGATIALARDPSQGALIRQGVREYVMDAQGVQNYLAQLRQQAERGIAAQSVYAYAPKGRVANPPHRQQLWQIMGAENPMRFGGVAQIGYNVAPSQDVDTQVSATQPIHQVSFQTAAEHSRIRDMAPQQQQGFHPQNATYSANTSQPQHHRPNTGQPAVGAVQQWQQMASAFVTQQGIQQSHLQAYHQNRAAASSRAFQGTASPGVIQSGTQAHESTFRPQVLGQTGNAHQDASRQVAYTSASTSTTTTSAQQPPAFGSHSGNVVSSAPTSITHHGISQAQNSHELTGQPNHSTSARTYSRPPQTPSNSSLGSVIQDVVDRVGQEKAKEIFAQWLTQRRQAGPNVAVGPSGGPIAGSSRLSMDAMPANAPGPSTEHRVDPPPQTTQSQAPQPQSIRSTPPVINRPNLVSHLPDVGRHMAPVQSRPSVTSLPTSHAPSAVSSIQHPPPSIQTPAAPAPTFRDQQQSTRGYTSTFATTVSPPGTADSTIGTPLDPWHKYRQGQTSQQVVAQQQGEYRNQTWANNAPVYSNNGNDPTPLRKENHIAQAKTSGSTSSSSIAGQVGQQLSTLPETRYTPYAYAQSKITATPGSMAQRLHNSSSFLPPGSLHTAPAISPGQPTPSQPTTTPAMSSAAVPEGTHGSTGAGGPAMSQHRAPQDAGRPTDDVNEWQGAVTQGQVQFPEQPDPETYVMSLSTSEEIPEAVRRPPNRKTLARDLLRSLSRSADDWARGSRESRTVAPSTLQVETSQVEQSRSPLPPAASLEEPSSQAQQPPSPTPIPEDPVPPPSSDVLEPETPPLGTLVSEDSEPAPPSVTTLEPDLSVPSSSPPLPPPDVPSMAALSPPSGPTVIDLTGYDTPPAIAMNVSDGVALPTEPYAYAATKPYIQPVDPLNVIEGLSFAATPLPMPTRTPTPPLMATIMDVDDEREVIEVASGSTTEVGRPSEVPSLPEGSAEYGPARDRSASIAVVEDVMSMHKPPPGPAPFVRRLGLLESPVKSRTELPSHPNKRRKLEMFVLIPTPPEYEAYFRRKRQRLEEEQEDESAVQAVVEESIDVLRPSKCYWDDCGDVLNSSRTLWKHMETHVKAGVDLVTCQFNHCGAVVGREDRSQHFRRHALPRMPCPYDGFSNEQKLYDHTQEQHNPDDDRKLSATLLRPDLPEQVDALPTTLPSYMSSTRLSHVRGHQPPGSQKRLPGIFAQITPSRRPHSRATQRRAD